MSGQPDASAIGDGAVGPCSGMEDGVSCGKNGLHCVHGACLANVCGDGVRAFEEECDDGAELVQDDCSPACRIVPVTCGNGLVEVGEECDDGDSLPDNACSTECTLNRCGNQRRDFGEECDDGNQSDADFCATTCTRILCRNGRIDPGEECDDGNNVETDGCTNACLAIGCGDGIRQADAPLFEECDDANDIDGDACSNQCTENRCGNSRVDVGELCDGNLCEGGKVCNATCDACESDLCDQCLKEKCGPAGEFGVDVYTPCFETATSEHLFGKLPGPTFSEDCSALVHCIRFAGCYDYDPLWPFDSCICEDDDYQEITVCEELTGPCIDVMDRATRNGESRVTCANQDATTFGSCLNQTYQDLTFPTGHAYFILHCMNSECATECSVPAP